MKGGKKWVRRGKRAVLGAKERRGLIQMGVSLLIFLTVFAGLEAFPARAALWREELLGVLRRDTNFEQVLRYIGLSVARETPILEAADTVWQEVFFGETPPLTEPDQAVFLALRQPAQSRTKPALLPASPTPAAEPADPVASAVRQELGLGESVTPVLGVLTSGFGVREHPIDGETRMHDGVDLAADEGTPIEAFADGIVDYIGESPAYGMYIQLRHDNGITTFYAHCSQLCVGKGTAVKKGDVVAKVGNTGNSTGPHLHFEMKRDGERVDPLSYIHYLTE